MMINGRQHRCLIVLLFISALAVLYVQWPALQNKYIVDDDWRQYYWMERFVDPQAFADDWILDNLKQVRELNVLGTTVYLQYESWAFSLLYWLGSFFVAPITFNKIVPFGLMLISVFYLFRYGQLVRNHRTAFLLGLIFIVYTLTASPNISLLPGLERSFSLPLLIVFLYYFRRQSSVGIAVTLALQAIVYFPIFVVCAAAYAFSLITKKGNWPTLTGDFKRWLPLFIGVGLGFLFFLPALLQSTQAVLPYATDVPVWENPYYGPTGRIPIFWSYPGWNIDVPIFLLIGYGGLAVPQGINHMVPLLLIFLVMLAVLGVRQVTLPYHTRLLLWASLASFALVWLVALIFNDFILRYPFKYTSASLPLVLMIVVAYNGEVFSEKMSQLWLTSKGRRGILLVVIGFIVLIVMRFSFFEFEARMATMSLGALVFILGVNQLALLRLRTADSPPISPHHLTATAYPAFIVLTILSVFIHLFLFQPTQPVVESSEYELYDFIAALPVHSFFAGDPKRLSNIPAFAKHGILFSAELSGVEGQKILDFYDAYYAESPDTILAFCNSYGVTHLLVDQTHFSEDYLARGAFFFSPYNADIKKMTQTRSHYVLMHVPDEQKLFQGTNYFVIRCQENTLANLN